MIMKKKIADDNKTRRTKKIIQKNNMQLIERRKLLYAALRHMLPDETPLRTCIAINRIPDNQVSYVLDILARKGATVTLTTQFTDKASNDRIVDIAQESPVRFEQQLALDHVTSELPERNDATTSDLLQKTPQHKSIFGLSKDVHLQITLIDEKDDEEKKNGDGGAKEKDNNDEEKEEKKGQRTDAAPHNDLRFVESPFNFFSEQILDDLDRNIHVVPLADLVQRNCNSTIKPKAFF